MSWVILSIFASLAQSIRTALQKNLKTKLSTISITWIRFAFGVPFAVIYFLILTHLIKETPILNSGFFINCFAASISQIMATLLLISLFSYKNFAVGTTYAKTETVQTAILGMIFFGEYLSNLGILAIILGIFGIFMISISEEKINLKLILKSITKKHAVIGILSGTFFSFSALFIKNASVSLESGNILIKAATTLLVMTIIQTSILGFYLYKKEKEQLKKIKANYKQAFLIGLTSILGSIGWFSAFTMTNVAYVKTVGQIELIFSLLISRKIFKEKQRALELCGIIVVITSIILLILGN